MLCNLGNRIVNNYLLSSDVGYILIDTGYDGSFPHFLKMLRKNGVDPGEIRYVFLTHAHDDHAGFLNEVLAATDAQVILHPKAVAGLRRGQNAFEGGCSSHLAWLFCQILALFGHGEHRYPPIRDEFLDRLIPIDSERFRSLGFPYEIIETPGHTADHISLLVGDRLFCGDAAMNGFPSRRRTIIWIENLRQYQQSWDTILQKAPAMLYPGHGRPFKTSDLRQYRKSLERIRLYPLRQRRAGRGDSIREGERMNPLNRQWFFKGFRKRLEQSLTPSTAAEVWEEAGREYRRILTANPSLRAHKGAMALPAVALYRALASRGEDAEGLLNAYGDELGEKFARFVHALTSLPGVSKLLWSRIDQTMDKMSGEAKGYQRRIASKPPEMFGVDILSCPYHELAKQLGTEKAVLCICHMDKAY